ncbi:MAG: hypothetical protein U9R06_00475 [Patescibacteria group bacterium]|nr:hypothetical protein [Patescibacteria group bacterium]
MKRWLKQFLILICLVVILILPYFVFAEQSALERLDAVGAGEGRYSAATETSASEYLGLMVNAFLGVLGIIFIILIIIAGFNWMTASGDDEKLVKAQRTIRRAIVGLLVVAGAYVIQQYIFARGIIDQGGL